jgi:hypothetical protein
MGDVEIAGERTRADLVGELATQGARKVGIGFRGQREPGRPQREARRDQRRDEELQHRHHASALT